MDFFEHQRHARNQSQRLVVLFGLAVVAIIAAVNALGVLLYTLNESSEAAYQAPLEFWPAFWIGLKYTAPPLIFVIGATSLTRIAGLSGGGSSVAKLMGAEALPLQSDDEKDRRLRHVVEEMAIASGLPVPEIYVMRNESGINAFAAGTEPSNAVVAVTQGALDKLDRDQLQGVVAHEFSHIFNGDMRLNIRLMGTLAGILLLATLGRFLMESMGRSRSRSRKGDGEGALLLLGLGLMVIGYIGVFFGRWIKAAVSRQREYLADASAVQYTRNPGGLAGALAAIRAEGSSVHNAYAEEASHFFFGSVMNFSLFATHPPIEERLRRLDQARILEESVAPSAPRRPVQTASAARHVGRPQAKDLFLATTVIQGLGHQLRERLHQPRPAMQLVIALIARENGNQAALDKIEPAIRALAEKVPTDQILTMVDLAMPALRRLEPMHAASLLQALELMAKEDHQIKPLEMAVLSMVRRQVAGPSRGSRSAQLRDHLGEAATLLRALSISGHPQDTQAAFAAFTAGIQVLTGGRQEVERLWGDADPNSLAVDHALTRLTQLKPDHKRQLFEAIWATAHHDKTLTSVEAQYVRAFSEALEIPLPPTVT